MTFDIKTDKDVVLCCETNEDWEDEIASVARCGRSHQPHWDMLRGDLSAPFHAAVSKPSGRVLSLLNKDLLACVHEARG